MRPQHRHRRAHRRGQDHATERILFYTGRIHKIGEVHEGTAVMDWMEQEQERGITITAPRRPCTWRDTGSTSSTRPATSTSPSRWSAPCACSTARSRCSTPSTAWSPSPRRSGARPTSTTCRASCFINKMDRVGADFYRCVDMIRERLGDRRARAAARSAPRAFRGVVDLVEMKRPHRGRRQGRDVRPTTSRRADRDAEKWRHESSRS